MGQERSAVSRPRLVEYASASGFVSGSAFAGPGLAATLKPIQEAVDGTRAQAIFFGHCDASGDDQANKVLSDRRAEVMRALFTSDVPRMLDLARQDQWDLAEYQAMLRALGYVPGAIDGEPGPMTEAAIEAFVFEHGKGELPCTVGDVGACEVLHDRSPRCRFYALWDPGERNPFDVRQWVPAADPDPLVPPEEVECFPVPTFKITLGEHWAHANPPGRPLHRIFVEREQDEVIALLSDGSFARITAKDPRLEPDYDPDLFGVAVYPLGGRLAEQPE